MRFEKAAVHDLAGQRGAGVIVICGAHALLCQRGEEADNPGTWAPFGGMVDPGESTEDAARRELGEESGVWLETPFIHFFDSNPSPEGFVFSTYLTFVDERPIVDLEVEESSGYGWFNLNFLPSPRHPGFNTMVSSKKWADLLTRLQVDQQLRLVPGAGVTRLKPTVEEARIKGDDEYKWFRYKGEDLELPWRNSLTETLSKGDVFGVRWSSNGKNMRLILKRLGTTKVFTIDQSTADHLRKYI